MTLFDLPERTPALRRALRLLVWLGAAGYFVFALLILLLRYAILPQIDRYRGDLEEALAATLHRPVTVARIDAGWQGLRPRLALYGFSIKDDSGRPALSFEHIEAVVAWSSLLHLEPRLYRLELLAPELAVRRDPERHLFVAGLQVDSKASGGGFGDWLLRQDEIIVTDATVTWTDEARGAPPLAMSRLNLRLDNGLRRHRFGLTFLPPRQLASPLDIRGDLHGRHLDEPESWTGQLYARVDDIDLAAWRNWIDYPVELPQGRGALRMWLDFDGPRPTELTADLGLISTHLRLAKNLPLLDLERLEGRVQARRSEDGGLAAAVTGLRLATRDGLHLQPTDASLSLQRGGGEFSTRYFDLGSLSRLATYLPVPAELRSSLAAYAPGGRLHDFKLAWQGQDKPEKFRVSGHFEALHLAAQGKMPGFSGFSGKIEGDESAGNVELVGRDAALDLPAVFPEPRLTFTALDAMASWKRGRDGLEIRFANASFHNNDAQGTASGRYSWRAGSMGDIDLQAKLTRAEGGAVWRYLPFDVGQDARDWLRPAIIGGTADEASLELKGNLDRFPFVDHSGVFKVKARFHGPTLHYADGWPQIEGITGRIEFDGPRMTVEASAGRILGTGISQVKAEIADLDAADETLTVTGKVNGPTAEFLKFIEASPVGGSIDHFTRDMSAGGDGELDLKLVMPLRHIDTTKVAGSYRFDGDHLVADPALPPFDDVRGRLEFSADNLAARDLRGRMLGGPVRINLKTQDGALTAAASGEANMGQMRQQYANPLFEHLSGTTRWNGSLRVKKKNVEFRIASNLQGVTSSLPEPFNKTAGEAMPLLLERHPVDVARSAKRARDTAAIALPREQIDFGLGKQVRIQLQRRLDANGGLAFDRGIAVIGDVAPKWSERGVAAFINVPRLDVDFWRAVANAAGGLAPAGTTGQGGDSGSGVTQLDLRAGEMIALGRLLHDVRVVGVKPGGVWNLDLKSREVAGKLDWSDGGAGRLSGRITQFSMPVAQAGIAPMSENALKELPSLDLQFDRFTLRGMDFGLVKLAADNKGGYWDASVSAQTDDATLSGQGRWKPDDGEPDTHFEFKLKTKSIEKTLARLGYAGAVRRGRADLEGALSWKGAPHELDYASLDGTLKLDARDGQFNKLDPTVLGRLLGVISLQSLPRRISLDFRDIFSEGFAFDAISAHATVKHGVIDTRDMEIRGPAAKVQMAGSVNLVRETQDLKVRVQPALGESVATGVLLANPAVGAGAWVLNKLFGNPLDKAFAYDFAVTGNWADPKVEKLASQAPQTQGSTE